MVALACPRSISGIPPGRASDDLCFPTNPQKSPVFIPFPSEPCHIWEGTLKNRVILLAVH